MRDRFLKPKIKEIRKNLYETENKKNLSESKIKEVEKNLLELEENLSRHKKYCDYDDPEYKGIRDIGNLFNQSIGKDCYKPIKITNAFDNKNNYIEHESKGDKDKNLSPKKYLYMIRKYLSDIINDHKTQEVLRVHTGNKVIDQETTLEEWKIQLKIISSKDDSDEIRKMHTKIHNVQIMMGSGADEIIEELFESLLQNYQKDLEESMKGSNFIFDSVDLLYYHLQKTSLKRTGSSDIDSPKWLKNKKTTINPKNNDNNCFQCALTAALNYQNIKNHPERVSNLKPFIDQYNQKEKIFPPKQEKDWKNFESNNKSIALNILFVPYSTEEIARACIQKDNSKRENQVILLMITNGKKWHYLGDNIMETFIA